MNLTLLKNSNAIKYERRERKWENLCKKFLRGLLIKRD